MSNELIHVDIADNGINTTDEAQVLAGNLHDELMLIKTVTNASQQQLATAAGVKAQRFLKDLEACRVAVKAPVLALGSRIDALAKELSEPIKGHKERVADMCAKFNLAEQKRVEAENRERKRIEDEAIEAKRQADLAAEQAVAAMISEEDLNKAIVAEEVATQKTDEMYKTLTAPAPSVNKASGGVNKMVLKYEITDQAAAFAAAPHLFKVEIKPSAVNSTCTENTKINGMRFWLEPAVNFRG